MNQSHMTKSCSIPALMLLMLWLWPATAASQPAAPKVTDAATPGTTPNVVIILADDLGYGDVQCYNKERGKIPTPHIDRLAAQGMRFTDAHSSSGVCSPSRYTLLTGRYHWRTRLQAGIVGVWEKLLIAPDRLTLAGLARQHGYVTACVGKWHLGWDWPIPQGKRAMLWPVAEGDKDKPKDKAGAKPASKAKSAAASDEQRAFWKELFSQPIPGGPTARGFDEYFGTDVPNWPPYCFIENDRTVGIPSEFLPAGLFKDHLASLPGPALKDWKLESILPALADRASDFIARQAKAGKPFLLYLPLTAPHTPLAVNDAWKGKSGLGTYADFVMETDAQVGRVLKAIDDAGVLDNTLVIFTSDNGCAPYIGVDALEKQGHYPSGPLRGYKGDAFEGGHRVPFIVRYPGVTKPGSVCGQTVGQVDIMATLADVLGAKLPDTAGEDSVSLLPLLRGQEQAIHEAVVHHSSQGRFAIRSGKWKLQLSPGSGGPWGSPTDAAARQKGLPALQLYDLEADPGETKNLHDTQPAEVERLRKLLENMIAAGRSTKGPAARNDVEVKVR